MIVGISGMGFLQCYQRVPVIMPILEEPKFGAKKTRICALLKRFNEGTLIFLANSVKRAYYLVLISGLST
jgi:hypothetical protein